MRDLDQVEAEALLAVPSVCPGAEPWNPFRRPMFGYEAGAGLLDAQGRPRGLYTELRVTRGHKTQLHAFNFSVFRTTVHGTERVYQLTLVKYPALPSNQHAWPHEHVGSARIDHPEWLAWEYDDVLAHFCARTRITFEPPPEDPNQFKLTPS